MATVITAGNATNGLSLSADNTGSFEFKTGTGAGTTALTISSAQVVSMNGGVGGLVSGTAVASTSGTSINFTDIPSWVKRITVMFSGVSTNGTSTPLIQIGTSGTPTTTGYLSASSLLYTTLAIATSTAGFIINSNQAAAVFSGAITITNVSGNIWVASGITSNSAATAFTTTTAGNLSLAGVLNMVRITTVNGTDTFDAGSINILYE